MNDNQSCTFVLARRNQVVSQYRHGEALGLSSASKTSAVFVGRSFRLVSTVLASCKAADTKYYHHGNNGSMMKITSTISYAQGVFGRVKSKFVFAFVLHSARLYTEIFPSTGCRHQLNAPINQLTSQRQQANS